MKTIEQRAKEYADEVCEVQGCILTLKDEDVHNEINDAYIQGAKDAEEWIDINDELPERISSNTDWSEMVLVKLLSNSYDVKVYYHCLGTFHPLYANEVVTHWRPINKK